MSTTLFQNQFTQTQAKGQLDRHLNSNIIPVQIDPASSEADDSFIPGNFVKFADVAGGLPVVDIAVNADTDKAGVIFLVRKKNEYSPGDRLEIAFNDCFIAMEVSAAIAAGADVEWDEATNKIRTLAAGSRVGVAWTKAAADGDLILMQVKLPL